MDSNLRINVVQCVLEEISIRFAVVHQQDVYIASHHLFFLCELKWLRVLANNMLLLSSETLGSCRSDTRRICACILEKGWRHQLWLEVTNAVKSHHRQQNY